MAGATARSCPLCREQVPQGAPQCPKCGFHLPGDDQGVRAVPDPSVNVASPSRPRASGDPVLFLCPWCGGLVHGSDVRCPHCGASLGEEKEDLPAPEPPAIMGPRLGSGKLEEQQLIADLERALAAESESSPMSPGEVAEEAVARKRAMLTFLSAIPGVRPAAVGAVAGFFASLQQIALADLDDVAAIPDVGAEEARAIKETVDRFVRASPAEPPEHAVPPKSQPAPARPEPPAKPRRVPARPNKPPAPHVPSMGRERPPADSRLAPWRDIVAIATGIAIPAAALASWTEVPGREWGMLFLFGALFGIGASLTLSDLRSVVRSRPALLYVPGVALLLVVPLSSFVDRALVPVASISLVALGTVLLAMAAWRVKGDGGLFLPWLTGLLLLTVLAAAPLAFVTVGDAVTGAILGSLGGLLVLFPAGLVGHRRAMRFFADTRLAEAERALAKRDYAKALALYDETLAFAKRAGRETEAASYGKGAALVAVGRCEEALAVLDRALAANPGNEVAWVNKGAALSRLGRWRDALRCYNSAIRVNAVYEVAWNNKGNALSRLGNHEFALQCYERAIELDPGYRTAWVNRGYVLAKLGRYEEAARCADAALRLTAAPAAG